MCRWLVLALVAIAACGRVGFDESNYAGLVQEDGPIAYFRLESADTMTTDSSGNGHDGIYVVNAGTVASGQPGALRSIPDAATRFDADGVVGTAKESWVAVPSVAGVFAGDFTVEMFFQPKQEPLASEPLFICEAYQINGFRLGIDHLAELAFWTDEAAATTDVTSTRDQPSLDTWMHVAVTRHGASLRLYANGVLAGTDDALSYQPPGTSSLQCGFGIFHGMPGHIVYDEVAIYAKALDASQIAAHVHAR